MSGEFFKRGRALEPACDGCNDQGVRKVRRIQGFNTIAEGKVHQISVHEIHAPLANLASFAIVEISHTLETVG